MKNYMAFSKNKIPIVFSAILMFAMAFSLVALPAANAHTPSWDIPTYAYIVAAPAGILRQVLNASAARSTMVSYSFSAAHRTLPSNFPSMGDVDDIGFACKSSQLPS